MGIFRIDSDFFAEFSVIILVILYGHFRNTPPPLYPQTHTQMSFSVEFHRSTLYSLCIVLFYAVELKCIANITTALSSPINKYPSLRHFIVYTERGLFVSCRAEVDDLIYVKVYFLSWFLFTVVGLRRR